MNQNQVSNEYKFSWKCMEIKFQPYMGISYEKLINTNALNTKIGHPGPPPPKHPSQTKKFLLPQ